MAMSVDSNVDASLILDSDELQEMYCELCDLHFNKITTAEGFCVDCSEFMCRTCLGYHRIYMSQHILRDKYSMPHDFCFEKCTLHKDRLLKFYCSTCKAFACSECKANSHMNCPYLIFFPSTVIGIEQSDEIKNLDENLSRLIKKLNYTKRNIVSCMNFVKKQETRAKSTIITKREDAIKTKIDQQEIEIERFNEYMREAVARLEKERKEFTESITRKKDIFEEKIKKAETDITTKVENLKSADLLNLASLQRKVEGLLTDVKDQKSCLSVNRKTGQRCRLFVSLKTSEQHFNKVKQSVANVKNNIEFHVYNIHPIDDMLPVENPGPEPATDILDLKTTNLSGLARFANFDFEITHKKFRGRSLCFISATILIATDHDGSALVAFDVMQKQIAYIKLPSRPWAIAYIEHNKIAVTFPHANFVGLILFSDFGKVENSDQIAIGLRCDGIAYCNKKLFTSHSSNVKILDMSGNVLSDIDVVSNGKSLFKDPHYLAVNPNVEIIYVSDAVNNTVTSITFAGKVIAVYRDSQLSRPYELAVDETGAVFVCGQETNNVQQLTSGLTKVKTLLNENDGIDIPVGVSLCQTCNKLCVLLLNGMIKMFDLTM